MVRSVRWSSTCEGARSRASAQMPKRKTGLCAGIGNIGETLGPLGSPFQVDARAHGEQRRAGQNAGVTEDCRTAHTGEQKDRECSAHAICRRVREAGCPDAAAPPENPTEY